MAKSKVLVFKTAGNWGGFLRKYLVEKNILACCAHHVVLFTLVLDLWLGNSF